MRHIRPPRPVLSLLVVALLAAPLAAAHAQLPMRDKEGEKHEGVQLMARLAEWYATAVQWRDKAMEEAQSMYSYTTRALALRNKYENMAIGEMGRLGGYVPDWRDYSSMCGGNNPVGGMVSRDGTSICTANRSLHMQFDEALRNTFYHYTDPLFDKVDNVQDSLQAVVGSSFSRGKRWSEAFAGTAHASEGVSDEYMTTQAQQGQVLTDAAEQLNILVDSMTADEADGKPISSGRAKQITAHLSYAEAKVELDVARARLQATQLAIVQTADQLKGARATNYVATQAVTGW